MNLDYHMIAKRAYELWERSGYQPGRDVENWVQAETELVAASQNPAELVVSNPGPGAFVARPGSIAPRAERKANRRQNHQESSQPA